MYIEMHGLWSQQSNKVDLQLSERPTNCVSSAVLHERSRPYMCCVLPLPSLQVLTVAIDQEYKTIASAVAVAQPGSTILIAPGR
jgi:hypothetical protein